SSIVDPGRRSRGWSSAQLEESTVTLQKPEIHSINAVTFGTRDMARAVRFYQALGFVMAYGGETADFTSFRVGAGHLNLTASLPSASDGTHVIFYVDDVDAMYAHVLAHGFSPHPPPPHPPCP